MTNESTILSDSTKGFIGRHRNQISLLAHALLFCLSLLISYGLAYNFHGITRWFVDQFVRVLPLAVGIKIVVFWKMKLHRGSWRYVSLRDLFAIVKASHISAFLFVLAYFVIENAYSRQTGRFVFSTPDSRFRQSVFLLDWAATIGLVCSARVVVRFYYEALRPQRGQTLTRMLIVGAGDAGEAILREIHRMSEERYEVVGFLDDAPGKRGAQIHGVDVIDGTGQIQKVCDEYDVDEVLIALPTATQREIRHLISLCQGQNLRFRTVPAMQDLIEGRVTVSHIRDVSIDDLLGREQVTLDTDQIEEYLHGRRVLVTGAGGSIGSEMCRQIAQYKPERLVLIEQAENPLFHIERELRRTFPELSIVPYVADICDAVRVREIFATESPSTICHAAAHKHVPLMEMNPGEAIKNNIVGSRIIADAAVEYSVDKMVMISTDKAVNPTSIMGCTKRVAEMYVQHLSSRSHTQFVTVRFGNVLGSSGSVIPIFRQQIAAAGPLTVTHPDMVRYFMTIPESSQLVLQAGAMGKGGEIFLLDMGEPVKIVDLARDMITLSGLRPDEDIEITFTGVRPGEKLYEELAITGEDVSPTSHPKIGIWQHKLEDWDKICFGIEALIQLANGNSLQNIQIKLKQLVPEYQPEASPSFASSVSRK